MKSMTGFGSAKGATVSSYLEVNLRSVNGRFLEIRAHLPRELGSIESDIKKILGRNFQRGSIDIFVSRKSRGEKSNLKLYLHDEMAEAWITASMKLDQMIKSKNMIHTDQSKNQTSYLSVETLLQLPEVVGFEETEGNLELEAMEVKRLVEIACSSCTSERIREGQALRIELIDVVTRLETLVFEMTQLREEINHHLKEKMESRLKTRWSELELDSQRLQQELAILWDKSDITEELSRLKEHLLHYRNLLQSDHAQGKKLDFYTQELLREVNTIGSKSPMAQLTHIVVTAKTEIEKLREQVQNIE